MRFVIHGGGTGRLRQAVWDAMRDAPYVLKLEPAEQAQGGLGCTIVHLR